MIISVIIDRPIMFDIIEINIDDFPVY